MHSEVDVFPGQIAKGKTSSSRSEISLTMQLDIDS
jgi:hypothetical protein